VLHPLLQCQLWSPMPSFTRCYSHSLVHCNLEGHQPCQLEQPTGSSPHHLLPRVRDVVVVHHLRRRLRRLRPLRGAEAALATVVHVRRKYTAVCDTVYTSRRLQAAPPSFVRPLPSPAACFAILREFGRFTDFNQLSFHKFVNHLTTGDVVTRADVPKGPEAVQFRAPEWKHLRLAVLGNRRTWRVSGTPDML
jgi:hypothetical protein